MTIQQFKCLCEVVNCKNFSTASEVLFLSQSTVSRNILALEESMELKLMERHGRTSTLTEEGRKIMPFVWEIMQSFENLQDAIEDIHAFQNTSGAINLKLYTIPTIDEMELIPLIGDFMQDTPDHLIHLTVMEERMVLSGLTSQNCDIAFCSDVALDRRIFHHRPLKEVSFAVYVAKGHPLADRDSLYLQDLKDYAMVTPSRETKLLSLCINACKGAGFHPNIALTTTRPGIAKGFIERGKNISMGIDLGKNNFSDEQFRKIPLLDSPTFRYVFAWRKDSQQTKEILKFINEICPQ